MSICASVHLRSQVHFWPLVNLARFTHCNSVFSHKMYRAYGSHTLWFWYYMMLVVRYLLTFRRASDHSPEIFDDAISFSRLSLHVSYLTPQLPHFTALFERRKPHDCITSSREFTVFLHMYKELQLREIRTACYYLYVTILSLERYETQSPIASSYDIAPLATS